MSRRTTPPAVRLVSRVVAWGAGAALIFGGAAMVQRAFGGAVGAALAVVAAIAWLFVTAAWVERAEAEREAVGERERAALAEAELARAQMQLVLDNAPIGIVFASAGSERRLTNAAAEAMLGGPIATGADREAQLGGRFAREDGTTLRLDELPAPRALRGEPVRGEELVFRRADGRALVLEFCAAPVRDAAGVTTGAVVTFQDVSARRELERLREEYLALVSHDLRNPLTNIMLQAQALRRLSERSASQQQLEIAGSMLRSGRRIDRLVQDVLDFARVQAGRLQLTAEPVELGALVRDVVSEDVPPLDRARVRVDAPIEPVVAAADPARLERVVANLVVNALKYSPHDRPVTVALRLDEGRVRVEVADRGDGIPADELPHLFEKFYRAPGARARGHGLGLYICRTLVEAHGGRLDVESAPGRGSTFTVELASAAALGLTTGEHVAPGPSLDEPASTQAHAPAR